MLRGKDAQRRAEFEALLMPHLEALYGTAVRMTRSPAEADDLLQDTCLKAYRFLDRYSPGTNFKAWIFKVLTNIFINRYRKLQRDQAVRQEVEIGGHAEHVLAQGSARDARGDEDAILDRLMSEDIQAALGKLPPEFRMTVLLSDVEEFSYKEIAEIMDCPVGTVMSRLYRARRQLQRMLVKHAADRGFLGATAAGDNNQEGGGRSDVTDLATYRKQRRR